MNANVQVEAWPGPEAHHGRTVPTIIGRELRKTYSDLTAVKELNFEVFPGRVTGFLGPNGSGKTTTIHMMLGLVSETAGGVTINGVPYRQLQAPLTQVGASLDGQSFGRGRTGYRHLMCWAELAGASRHRVRELLHLVGLREAADRKIRTYSLGMRQRLALATALLGDPSILVLDEPANGLDPEGILWLRHMLRELARERRTILVASHMLAEAERMVDDVLLIRKGSLLYQGPLRELLDSVAAPSDGRHTDLEYAYLTLTRAEERNR